VTRNRTFVITALALTLFLAGVVSYWASSNPDGLNKVAIDLGFDSAETQHASDASPLAGYETKGVDNPWLSRMISGVTGVGITLAIGGGLFLVLRRGRSGADPTAMGAIRTTRDDDGGA
jgi:hypothetical protein